MGRRRSRAATAVGVLLACALVAGACGGDNGGDQTAGPTTTADPDAAQRIREGEAAGEDTRDAEDPVRGGRLIYGVEADSANPWVHYATSCAISCRMIFRAISDALFVGARDGDDGAKVVPYLLESYDHSDDYRQWTFTARSGITFHDGTPFDGEAMRYNIDVCRLAALTGPAYGHIASTEATGQTVTINLSAPDVALPFLFRDEQCGFQFSPTWMRTLESNPLRAREPDRVDPPTGRQAEPVGLGAFRFQSYAPGNGNSFVAVRNDDYWRADEGLPYLDAIEFVVAVDIQSRSNALRSGQFSIIHTANSDEGKRFQDEANRWALLQANAFGETSHTMFNVAQGNNPVYAQLTGRDGTMDAQGANADSPLLNVHCRRALAYAVDRPRFIQEREAGITVAANGPFPPGSLGYLEDTGFPVERDVERANQELETCLAELGRPSIEFSFNTTNDPFNVESNQLVVAMWREVFGDRVRATIAPVEQGQYIGLALVGTFEAFAWRNFAALDPNELFFWWFSGTSSPIGQLALNFGRFVDPQIDQSLLALRTNPDPDARQAAAEAISRRFGEQVYNLWAYWTLWTVAAQPNVRNLTNLPLPGDTDDRVVPVIAGKHHVAQIWCAGGNCGR